MSVNKQYKLGRDICVSVFLIVTMLLRVITSNTGLFAFFAFVSFIAAVYDIYVTVERDYSLHKKRFLIVRGAFLIGAIICTVLVTVAVVFQWNIDPLVVDELSILALLASLPKELHCYLLGKFIRGREDNDS